MYSEDEFELDRGTPSPSGTGHVDDPVDMDGLEPAGRSQSADSTNTEALRARSSQRASTPPMMVKRGWQYEIESRERSAFALQRVVRGHFARRAWRKPINDVKSWRKLQAHQPVAQRRPILLHIPNTDRSDQQWLRDAARAHLLVPIGCPDSVKWFPHTKAIKTWWYSVPDKIRRLFDTSQAQILPKWEDATAVTELNHQSSAHVPDAPEIRDPGRPRVTGGNFTTAKRFGEGGPSRPAATKDPKDRQPKGKTRDALPVSDRLVKATDSSQQHADNTMAHARAVAARHPSLAHGGLHALPGHQMAGDPLREPAHKGRSLVPLLNLGGATQDSQGRAVAETERVGRALSQVTPRGSKTGRDVAPEGSGLDRSLAADYKRLDKLHERHLAAVRRKDDLEDCELLEARSRIDRLKKANLKKLNDMRKEVRNPRHPLYEYGERFKKAFVSPATVMGWRGDKPPAWATFELPLDKKKDEQVALVPLTERMSGRGEIKKDFFSLLGTIKDVKRDTLAKKKNPPTVSVQAAALASKYQGIGAKFAEWVDRGGDLDTDAILPAEGWGSPVQCAPEVSRPDGAHERNDGSWSRRVTHAGGHHPESVSDAMASGPAPAARLGPKTPGEPLVVKRSRPALPTDRKVVTPPGATHREVSQVLAEAPPTPPAPAPAGVPAKTKPKGPFAFKKGPGGSGKGGVDVGSRLSQAHTNSSQQHTDDTMSHARAVAARHPSIAAGGKHALQGHHVERSPLNAKAEAGFGLSGPAHTLPWEADPWEAAADTPAPAAVTDVSKMSRVERMKSLQQQQQHNGPGIAGAASVSGSLTHDGGESDSSGDGAAADVSKMSRVERMKYLQQQQQQQHRGSGIAGTASVSGSLAHDGENSDSSSDDDEIFDVAAHRSTIKRRAMQGQ